MGKSVWLIMFLFVIAGCCDAKSQPAPSGPAVIQPVDPGFVEQNIRWFEAGNLRCVVYRGVGISCIR